MAESKKLGDFFAQYKTRLRAPQRSVESAARAVIMEVTGITLSDTAVSYRVQSRTLCITAPSILRSEIKAREPEIISALRASLGVRSAPEVII
jgi:hypothetical protein